MAIDDKIKNENLEYDINREAAKILAILSGKIDNIWISYRQRNITPDQSRIIEQAKFKYSSLGKAFEKQIKHNWRTRKKYTIWRSLKWT